MADLDTTCRLADPDGFYERLIEMHRGLDEEQSRLVNAKLILLLANHIGDDAVLAEAMEMARANFGDSPSPARGRGSG
jgi:hypothetical protein